MSSLGNCRMSYDPPFSPYKYKQISKLLHQREIGFCTNIFKNQLFRATNNSHSDFEFLRSILCDKQVYLETIACRKIQRSKAPAFCHGRLFTENYQTWFNLFTGPTSGPLLMTSDLFGANGNAYYDNAHFSQTTATTVKVVDIVCVCPPYNCAPPKRRKWRGPHIVLLTKSGWLFEADLESCEIISKTYIPTVEYVNNLHTTEDNFNSGDEQITSPNRISTHNYHYLTVNRAAESIVIKSSRNHSQSTNISTTAFCILSLYPLQLDCHFIVSVRSNSSSPPLSPDIIDDMFVINTTKASNISFYSLRAIVEEYHLGQYLSLGQKVDVPTPLGLNATRSAHVGDRSLGIPYTMRDIELSSSPPPFKAPCLFKAAAMKHCLQIGGPPYHYLVSTNKLGTSWALKHLDDDSEVSTGRIQIDEKWDCSHWNGIRFHGDNAGRFLKQDSSSLEMLSIFHENKNIEETENKFCCKAKSLLSNQTRHRAKLRSNCAVVQDFIINLQPIIKEPLQLQWHYPATDLPPLPPHTVTSHGRSIRRPRPLYSSRSSDVNSVENEGSLLVSVEYDHELNLLVLVYYRPSCPARHGWENQEEIADLVVSIFDSFFGKHLSTFVLETGTSPSDCDTIAVTLDQDTFIYTRLRPNDNRLQYKILRLNRRYGSFP